MVGFFGPETMLASQRIFECRKLVAELTALRAVEDGQRARTSHYTYKAILHLFAALVLERPRRALHIVSRG